MDEIDPEMQQYVDAAVKPLYQFDRHFHRVTRSSAQTVGWKRISHMPNKNYAQPGALQAEEGRYVASSIMVLEFRTGVIGIKAEMCDMADGEFEATYPIGSIISYHSHHNKFFWPALIGYITDSEYAVAEHQGNGSEILRLLNMFFERHLRKYNDPPPEEG